MTKPIIFLGGSQQVLEIHETCELLGLVVAGIIDDDYFGNTEHFEGIPYIGSEKTADWDSLKEKFDFFVTVNPVPGSDRNIFKRKNFINLVDRFDLPCVNIVDPDSRISPRTHMGAGIYVGYHVQIAPKCIIGDHCQIHSIAAIMHDVQIGRNSIINRAASVISNINIGDNVYVAPWAKLAKSHINIGSDSVIKTGVMVFRDTNQGEIVSAGSRKIYSMIADLPEDA